MQILLMQVGNNIIFNLNTPAFGFNFFWYLIWQEEMTSITFGMNIYIYIYIYYKLI